MEHLFDQILEALDTPDDGPSKENIPIVNDTQSHVEGRCIVTGKIFSLPESSWGRLVLKQGRVNLVYQNTEREFLIHQNEYTPAKETYEGLDNMVSPEAISEHDNRWLQREIQNMKISRIPTPKKAEVTKMKTPTKAAADYHRYAVEKSAKKTTVVGNPFAFQGYKDPTVLAFQPKNALARTPPVFK